ncbi:MAG: hypothetical protein OEY29_01200 [Gammaproteobacteria bacterium]|nr:hypothetical protein [Gammaproteobacteria bacterium]
MTEIQIENKPLQIRLSQSAERALQQRESGLFVEMELYFSCLIRKQVLFHEVQRQSDSVAVNDKLSVSFHPVVTSSCMVSAADAEPAKSDFEIQRRECFIPKWLSIDFSKGNWLGEFGY